VEKGSWQGLWTCLKTDKKVSEDRITARVECKRKAIPIIAQKLEPSQSYSENTSATYLESTK